MKINYSSTKNEFFLFYFSQIFLKKPIYSDEIYNFAEILKIDKSKIRSLEITNTQKIELFAEKNLEEFKDYHFLFDFYEDLNKEKTKIFIEAIIANLKRYYQTFLSTLTNLLGESEMPEEIDIAFVQPSIKENKITPNAFTGKFMENKIFLAFDEKLFPDEKETLEYYTKVLLHEITHIFINKNEKLQKILRSEWENKYRNIKVNTYRFNTEELLTKTLVFADKDFGFIYKDLGFKENEEKKEDSLSKNPYRVITLNFLNNLKNGEPLEKELPLFIEALVKVKKGMFE